MVCERRAKGIEREVGNDAQPAEKRRRAGVESRLGQALGERLVFKVQRNKGQVGGQGDGGLGQHVALPCWVAGKSTSKTRSAGKRIAIGEGVEARAEDHILRDSRGDGLGELVFGIAAARGHEGAKVARHLVHGALHVAGESGADQAHRDGIVKDAGLVHRSGARRGEWRREGLSCWRGRSP